MKHLCLTLLALSLCILPALADDTATEETAESMTETLENSTTETPENEEKTVLDDQQADQTEDKETRPRNKWDFSDRPKEKKDKKAKEDTYKDADNDKGNKFSRPKILNDTDTTWKSPTSGKIRRSTYSK